MKKMFFTSPEGQRCVKIGSVTLPFAQWREFTKWVKNCFGSKAKVGDEKLLFEVWMDCVK